MAKKKISNMSVRAFDKKYTKKTSQKKPGKEKIIVNPTEEDIRECAIIFGRMNPPTIGHQRLAEHAGDLCEKEDMDLRIYLSHTQDKNNPLVYEEKIKLAKKALGECVIESDHKNLFSIMEELHTEYEKIVIFAGSDRVDEWAERLTKYPWACELSFISLNREDDSENLEESASGTKVRQMIMEDNDDFKKYLPQEYNAFDISKIIEALRADFSTEKVTGPDGRLEWRKRRKRLTKEKETYDLKIEGLNKNSWSETPKEKTLADKVKRFIMPKREKQRRAIEDDG